MRISQQFLIFCVVGTIGFVVDLGVLYGLAPLLGWYGGRVASFWAAATTTWWLNRRFTFAAGATRARGMGMGIWREYGRYLATMLGGALLNYLVYAATLHWLPGHGGAALGVALGSLAGLSVNFLSARYLVCRRDNKP